MSEESIDLIHVPPGDYCPAKPVRESGRLHLCLMCDCGSFIPFLSMQKEKLNRVFAKCDGQLSFTCPSCDTHQDRNFPEFVHVVYTDNAASITP